MNVKLRAALRRSAVLGVALLTACASAPKSQVDSPAAADFASACAEARRLIRSFEHPDDFSQLSARLAAAPREVPSTKLHSCLQAGMLLGARYGDLERDAYRLHVLATQLPDAGLEDWGSRLGAARRLQDWPEATFVLTTLMRRWPQTVQQYGAKPIRTLTLDWDSLAVDEETRMALLEAAYDGKLKSDVGAEPSDLWLELTRLLVEHGKREQAAEVATHVTDALDVLALRVDRRFDSLVSADPQRFELNRAIERSLAEWTTIVARHPTKLGAIYRLLDRQLTYGHYDEALALANQTLDKIYPDTPQKKQPFDDLDGHLNWLYDSRAQAYSGLGRWNSAVHDLERAASLLEDGHENISNTINLASLQTDLGRPDEVIRILGPEFRRRMSDYGSMQLHLVLLGAAVQKNDTSTVDASLKFLREHQVWDPGGYMFGLVWTGNLDEAAALLVQRLKAPRLRIDALREVQDFREKPRGPFEQRMHERWLEVRARDEVRATIEQVGRIEQIPLP
jgi:tetratricopeptide (TPR) repeat protein